MPCTEAEILRLLELIDDEVFTAETYDEAKRRWRTLKLHIRELSLEDLRRTLGF